MIRGARTTRRGVFFIIASAAANSVFASRDHGRTNLADRRMREDRGWVRRFNAGRVQSLPRQIKPAKRSIFVEVAQNVGELERAAQVMSERKTGIAVHAEYPHRQTTDGAGDAVAIEIERGAIGCADVGYDIHFHAIDDGDEILALQIERAHRLRQSAKLRRRRLAINRINVGAPACQLLAARLARPGIVGNVVNGAAERVDLEHRLALRARQNAHARIKRAAGGALGRRSGLVHSRTPRLLGHGGRTPAKPPGHSGQNADDRQSGDCGHGKMHPILQRIA